MKFAQPLTTFTALLLASSAVVAACGRDTATVRSDGPATAAAPEDDAVAAALDGATIRRSEVDKRVAGTLAKLENEAYEARRRALDEILSDRLLAREAEARGMSKDALVKAEVDAKVKAPSQAEISAFYAQVAPRLGGRTLADVQPQIEESLRQQALDRRRAAYTGELRKKFAVKIALEPPRAKVPLPADAPALGPEKAPITIVEYLDYQCPYCRRAQGIVDELMDRYKGKIRFVHRDFPITGHPRALPTAQATRCAGEQGKFWEYHKGIFDKPSDLSDDDLRSRAKALGLEAGAFAACLASGRHDASINAAAESGTALGVDSTPTFFVNGRRVTGALPVPQFEEIIDEELALAGS